MYLKVGFSTFLPCEIDYIGRGGVGCDCAGVLYHSVTLLSGAISLMIFSVSFFRLRFFDVIFEHLHLPTMKISFNSARVVNLFYLFPFRSHSNRIATPSRETIGATGKNTFFHIQQRPATSEIIHDTDSFAALRRKTTWRSETLWRLTDLRLFLKKMRVIFSEKSGHGAAGTRRSIRSRGYRKFNLCIQSHYWTKQNVVINSKFIFYK